MLDYIGAGLGVVHRESSPPFKVGDERGAKLGIVRQAGVVGGEAHQRSETETLFRRDPQAAMLGEHPVVATELLRVARRTTEHLTPPGDHVVEPPNRICPFGKEAQELTIVAASAIRWSFVQGAPKVARGPWRTSSASSARILAA